MEINQKEWELETAKLEDVCHRINTMLNEKRKSAEEYKEDVIEIRRSMWDNTAHVLSGEFDESVEILQYINLMRQEEESHKHTSRQIRKLEKLLETPYFARIDFVQDDYDDKENVYIGMSSLIDNDTMDIIIYDWRAPISSMFYEHELGDASFEVGDKVIEGKVELKRQYKIQRSKLLFMFNSSVKIDDEILQEILSKNADDKMKNIVISIQKEQDKIIRDEKTRTLIIQGAAGSGKTSIALHRIAYLLYRHREDGFKSKNIVIFSPNQIFNDYISDVLPELGEENVHQTTFYEYASSCIGNQIKLESLNEQMDFMLSRNDDCEEYVLRKNNIAFKSSLEFLEVLDKYLDMLHKCYEGLQDVTFNKKLIASKEELENLYTYDYKHFAPIARLKKINDRINYLLRPHKKARLREITEQIKNSDDKEFNINQVSRAILHNELRELSAKVDAMTAMDPYKLYIRLFEESEIFEAVGGKLDKETSEVLFKTADYLKQGSMNYEDIAPYLYLKGMLEGSLYIADIRHVVIDEAQDYSYLQYQIIKKLFRYASFTILGDVNQAIYSYMHTADYKTAAELFNDYGAKVMTLSKSYRSTREIWELSLQISPELRAQQHIGRRGDKPQLIKVSQAQCINKTLTQKLQEFKTQGMKSIAIICKTAEQCETLFSKIKKEVSYVNVITSEASRLNSGINIIPSYLAKGLEFDAVIVYDVSKANYSREIQRKLMYTMCTRALHKLCLIYKGELTELLQNVDKEYLEVITIE